MSLAKFRKVTKGNSVPVDKPKDPVIKDKKNG